MRLTMFIPEETKEVSYIYYDESGKKIKQNLIDIRNNIRVCVVCKDKFLSIRPSRYCHKSCRKLSMLKLKAKISDSIIGE
jgi:recombinational DNA repair protein RecR